MKKRLKRIIIAATLLAAVCIASVCIYTGDYYRADETAAMALKSTETVSVEITDDMAIFCPDNTEAGFIFYPGGKVEYTAYAPLM